MISKLFSQGRLPAIIDTQIDVLNRPTFSILTWHGPTPDDHLGGDTGWWHFGSGIVDPREAALTIFDEVTSSGYEIDDHAKLSEETLEILLEMSEEALPDALAELILNKFPGKFQRLDSTEAIQGFDTAEFQQQITKQNKT